MGKDIFDKVLEKIEREKKPHAKMYRRKFLGKSSWGVHAADKGGRPMGTEVVFDDTPSGRRQAKELAAWIGKTLKK